MICFPTTAVKMASCRKCLQSLDEIQRMLEESGSECDNVFSEGENSSRSESESRSESGDCWHLNAVRKRLKKLVYIGAPCVIKSSMPMG